jgi:hypothetical protein
LERALDHAAADPEMGPEMRAVGVEDVVRPFRRAKQDEVTSQGSQGPYRAPRHLSGAGDAKPAARV